MEAESFMASRCGVGLELIVFVAMSGVHHKRLHVVSPEEAGNCTNQREV